MKTKHILIFALVVLISLAGCKSKPFGSKVKESFDGNAYESNSRYFRGTGKGESSKENIAYGKADMNAKSELAGQVNTTMRQVADQYLNEAANADASEVMEQFESLTRQVMNTQIADLRKIGEKKFYNGDNYTVFMAYEIKKKAMLKFMKKQAEIANYKTNATKTAIIEMLQEEINKIPDDE